MKFRWITVVFLSVFPLASWAAGSGIQLLSANTDVTDKASLQRGAKLFVNYCMGCHAISYMRYNRMGRDIGLTDEQVADNLMFATDKVANEMKIAMRGEEAAEWFGVPPPDLSVTARAKGSDWLYSYLVTFYGDSNPSRPFGVNNVVFPDVAMPHALWSLQGVARYVAGEAPEGVTDVEAVRLRTGERGVEVIKRGVDAEGKGVTIVDRLLTDGTGGEMAPGQYRKAARDLVNFLQYVSEPAQLVRGAIGFWVVVFLLVFFFLSRALYKEYWRDVH